MSEGEESPDWEIGRQTRQTSEAIQRTKKMIEEGHGEPANRGLRTLQDRIRSFRDRDFSRS